MEDKKKDKKKDKKDKKKKKKKDKKKKKKKKPLVYEMFFLFFTSNLECISQYGSEEELLLFLGLICKLLCEEAKG